MTIASIIGRPSISRSQQLVGRLAVANAVDAQGLQGAGNGADVAQDFLLARTPHRLADRPRRLVRGLRRLHHEIRQVDDQRATG